MSASTWSQRHRRLYVLLLLSYVLQTCSFQQLCSPGCGTRIRSTSTLPFLYSPTRSRNPLHFTTNTKHHPRLLWAKTRHRSILSASPFLIFLQRPSVTASLALILSTSTGWLSDKFFSSAGILVTLTTAAVLSNVGVAPTCHPLYDLCWTLFLPASLALLLLSLGDAATTIDNDSLTNIRRMGLPFAVGSIGSVVGCWISYLICLTWPNLWLTPPNAAIAASCLCASYIGGSVNFFATSRIVGGPNNLITSMAAADLLVMALYFAFLTAALQSSRLKALFFNDDDDGEAESNIVKFEEETDSVPQIKSCSLQMGLAAMLVAAALSLGIVQIANRVEGALARIVPGTACAVICLLGTLVSRHMMPRTPFWRDVQCTAKPLSQICFHLLFASLGMTANLGQALVEGPACVWFSLTALLVHIVITLSGSLVLKRLFGNVVKLEHVLVASNAAIGGPATAAAFCGQIPSTAGLAVAATVWGVVGYAVGTGIGVRLYQLLLHAMD